MAALLLEVGIALTAIALAGALANRYGLSVIPAYIVVGVLVGPNEPTSIAGVPLTLVEHREFIDVLAELGVVFLLFFLGLEFSIGQLLDDRKRLATIGSVDFAVNFGLGALLGFAFGYTLLETMFLAGIVYISSSAVITKSLIDEGWVANPESSPILGTLVFEDLLIAVYLAVLSAVALGEGTPTDAVVAVATAFAFLGVLTLVAWYGTEYVERLFDADSDELFLLRVLGVTTLVAGAALTAGLSEAVAAFFGGHPVDALDDRRDDPRNLVAVLAKLGVLAHQRPHDRTDLRLAVVFDRVEERVGLGGLAHAVFQIVVHYRNRRLPE